MRTKVRTPVTILHKERPSVNILGIVVIIGVCGYALSRIWGQGTDEQNEATRQAKRKAAVFYGLIMLVLLLVLLTNLLSPAEFPVN